MKLSASKVRSIGPQEKLKRYSDGGGLYLVVYPSGAKNWIHRATVNGRRTDVGLGSFPAVSLAKARERCQANREAVADGVDVVAEKRREVPTLREAAERIIELNRANWSATNTERVWRGRLESYVFPKLGQRPVDSITVQDVLRILTPLWTTKAETGRRVRYILRQVFNWAAANSYRPDNPAGEIVNGALPRQPQVKTPRRALHYSEVPAALRTITESTAFDTSKLCFKFLVLTAARSSEARGATWDEIDMDARTWTIPAQRMKARQEHRVPLSAPAVEVLQQAEALDDGSGLVFPSPARPGRMLSDMALIKLTRDNDLADRCTPHGFRSSFRSWSLEQTDCPWAVAEAALAHRLGNPVEAVYVRGDLFERRRELMQRWADYVTVW